MYMNKPNMNGAQFFGNFGHPVWLERIPANKRGLELLHIEG